MTPTNADRFYQTCGQLYGQAVEIAKQYPGDPISKGFLIGQVEKVYLGACQACMTRDLELRDFAWELARLYGLNTAVFHGALLELWVYRDRLSWPSEKEDSPRYHLLRAAACGIPAEKIDLEFHHRHRSTHATNA